MIWWSGYWACAAKNCSVIIYILFLSVGAFGGQSEMKNGQKPDQTDPFFPPAMFRINNIDRCRETMKISIQYPLLLITDV